MWSHKGVYRVELYAAVRRAVYVEGISQREASKRFGMARKTVHKMLGYSVPPGYQRKQPVKRPKLEAFLGVIDQILEEDKQQIRKQRHTAEADFRTAEARTWLYRRLHGREGLRARAEPAAERDVRAAGASAR